MKYYLNGQKKEPFINKRKNRLLVLGIAGVIYVMYAILEADFLWVLTNSIWTIIVFVAVEIYMWYTPNKDYVTSLEINDKAITLEYFYEKHDQHIRIEDLAKLERSLTEITVIKKDGSGILIPLTIFSYDDIQLIKAEIDDLKTRINNSETIGDTETISI
ncbi:MAG: hypothetical protein RIF34_02125 [Candidatus Kapaibacterium sp.]